MSDLGKDKNLEELFFYKENQRLMEKLRAMKQLEETREALRQVSGIDDPLVLDKMIELDVRPETLASIALVPLIEIAWADRVVGPKEKEAVLRAVKKLGWTKESLDYAILNEWLDQKPTQKLFDAWRHYVGVLCGRMTDEEIEHFKKEIMEHSAIVARAEGGILGIGSVSDKEQRMIDAIAASFCR